MEIEGYPNYLIYEDGSVYSKKTNKYLKKWINNRGYHSINLFTDGKRKHYTVHRLVGLTYIPNPHNYEEIDHIDRDKCNNHLYNLRWCDRQTNLKNREFTLKSHNNNKLGIKNISAASRSGYTFKITRNGKRHEKNFKTLEEAIKYKEEYMKKILSK
jgi:hypothetical protein